MGCLCFGKKDRHSNEPNTRLGTAGTLAMNPASVGTPPAGAKPVSGPSVLAGQPSTPGQNPTVPTSIARNPSLPVKNTTLLAGGPNATAQNTTAPPTTPTQICTIPHVNPTPPAKIPTGLPQIPTALGKVVATRYLNPPPQSLLGVVANRIFIALHGNWQYLD